MRFAAVCVALGAMVLFAACGSGSGATTVGGATGPTATSIDVSGGSVNGGTAVTIQGTDFVLGGTSVSFGGVAATGMNVVSTTLLTCVSPAHAAGTVDVVTSTAGGSSTLSQAFTFRPVLDAIVASRGSGANGGVFIFRDFLNATGFTASVVLDNAGSGMGNNGHIDVYNDWLVTSSRDNNTVSIFQGIPTLTSGQAPTAVLSGFSCPAQLCISSDGDLYVCDRCNNRIRIYRDITTLVTGDAPDAEISTSSCPVSCALHNGRLFIGCRCTNTNSLQIWDNAATLAGGEAPDAQLDIMEPRRIRIHQDVLWVKPSYNTSAIFGYSGAGALASGATADRAIFGLVPVGDYGDITFAGGTGWLSTQWDNEPLLSRVTLGAGLVTMPDATIDESILNEDAVYDIEVAANTLLASGRESSFAFYYYDALGFVTDQAPDGFLFDARLQYAKEVRIIER